MRYKRYVVVIITIVTLIATAFNAVAGTFPDILERHSWAEQYIEDMVKRGLLKGYTDGTFKPDNPISKLEAIILASRILGVTYDENKDFVDAALAAFEGELAAFDIQYKTEAAYLLYWGALRIAELPAYIGDDVKNTAMNRHEVAKLLTKIMGGEAEAQGNPIVILDYADVSEIPAAAKAYVQYISDRGIMQGMEDNKFMPMYPVTRAMIATMMHRVEQAMDMGAVNANVLSINGDVISVEINGSSSEVTLPEDVLVRVDGLAASLAGIKEGYNIRLRYQGEKLRLVEAVSTRTQSKVSGVIKAISNNNGIQLVTITPTGSAGEASTVYTLDKDCAIIVDNVDTFFSSLKNNYFVQMEIKDNKVVRLTAETKEYTKTGTITAVDLSGSSPVISFRIKDSSVEKFNTTADVSITRNNAADEIRSLSAGDNATITVSAGRITKINATSVNKAIEGSIEEIIISSNPSITIKTGGVSKKYAVAPDSSFYVEDEASTIYDMRLGATASLTLKSENIDKITIKKAVVPSQIIGTVTSVNPAYNVLVLDVVDPDTGTVSSQTVVVRSAVKIVDNTSSKVSTFKGITPGRSIIALGGLDNYGTYAVTTIIITQ